MTAQVVGLAAMAVIAFAVAFVLLWRRRRAVFWFAIALSLLGLGYLSTTPAPSDLVHGVLGAPSWLSSGAQPDA